MAEDWITAVDERYDHLYLKLVDDKTACFFNRFIRKYGNYYRVFQRVHLLMASV